MTDLLASIVLKRFIRPLRKALTAVLPTGGSRSVGAIQVKALADWSLRMVSVTAGLACKPVCPWPLAAVGHNERYKQYTLLLAKLPECFRWGTNVMRSSAAQ